MERTAIILAGGVSQRFGCNKGLAQLAGKPLVSHVFDRVSGAADEVLVVVGSAPQRESYAPLFPKETRVLVDVEGSQSPLVGALTGFMNASGEFASLLPCDTPFVSKDVLELLFDISRNMDAVIPRWPNGYIEPLHAVYRTSSALVAAEKALTEGARRMQSMISLLRKVRYLSTMVIKDIDPALDTFFNVNTLADLRKAEALLNKRMMARGRSVLNEEGFLPWPKKVL